jgi:hypothetical protein
MSVTRPLGGTHYALVSDGGISDNALRLIDVDARRHRVIRVRVRVSRGQIPASSMVARLLPPGQIPILRRGRREGSAAFDASTPRQARLARAKGCDSSDPGLGLTIS